MRTCSHAAHSTIAMLEPADYLASTPANVAGLPPIHKDPLDRMLVAQVDGRGQSRRASPRDAKLRRNTAHPLSGCAIAPLSPLPRPPSPPAAPAPPAPACRPAPAPARRASASARPRRTPRGASRCSAGVSASSSLAIFSRSATVAISLEATPASSARAFSSTFSSSTTAPAAGEAGAVVALDLRRIGLRVAPAPRAIASSSSGPIPRAGEALGHRAQAVQRRRRRWAPGWPARRSPRPSGCGRAAGRAAGRCARARRRRRGTPPGTWPRACAASAAARRSPGRRRRAPDRSSPAISSVTQASRPAFSSRSRSIG